MTPVTCPGTVIGVPMDRFPGIPGTPSLDHLTFVYQTWCRTVAFDNALRWLALHSPSSKAAVGDGSADADHELRAVSAARFWGRHVRFGCGGMCVPTALGLASLLTAYGYRFSQVLASIDGAPQPDHVTTLVTLGEGTFVLDTVAMNERPVPLRGRETAVGLGAHRVQACPRGHAWELRWSTPAHRSPQRCVIWPAEVLADPGEFYARSQASETFSRFNAGLYARINTTDGGIAVVTGPFTVRVHPDGRTVPGAAPSVVLRDEFHWSDALIGQLSQAGAIA
jgi:hypothetical protein